MKNEHLIATFEVKTAALNNLLTKFSKIVGKKGCGLPTLEHIYIQKKEPDSETLYLTASNQETAVTCNVMVKMLHENNFKDMLLPIHKVLPILKTIKVPSIIIEYYAEGVKLNNKIIIQAGRNKHEFTTQDPIEYLEVADIFKKDTLLFNIPADEFIENIKTALPYCGNNELRPAQAGIYFELSKENMLTKFTATNAYMVFHSKGPLANTDASFVIPAEALKKLLYFVDTKIHDELAFFAKFKEKDGKKKDDKDIIEKIVIEYTGYIFSMEVIQETFPPYQNVIPEGEGIKITVDYNELLNTAKIAKLTAEVYNHQGKFQVNPMKEGIRIITEDTDIGTKSTYEINCKHEIKNDFEFILDLKLLIILLDSYKDFKPDSVDIHIYEIGKPIKIVIAEDMQSIIMPIRH